MAIDSLKILQWNCRSLSAPKIAELNKISNEYDILLLNETWLSFVNQKLLKNFVLIQRNRSRQDKETGGGVAIAIRENIEFDEFLDIYHHESNLETVAISVSIRGGKNNLILVSYYSPSDSATSTEDWSKLFQSVSKFKYKIIGGDARTPHTLGFI